MDAPNGNAAPAAPHGLCFFGIVLVGYVLFVILSCTIICISMLTTTGGFAIGNCSNQTDPACSFINSTHMDTSTIVLDGFYFGVVSMLTIGYGDIHAIAPWTRFATCVVIILGYTLTPVFVEIISTEAGLLIMKTDWWIGLPEDSKRRCKNGFAFLVVSVIFLFGFLIARTTGNETGDSFYLAFITLTTEGYGNMSYNTYHGKIFSTVWIAVLLPFFQPAWAHLTSWIPAYIRSLGARLLIWAGLQPVDASIPLPPIPPPHDPVHGALPPNLPSHDLVHAAQGALPPILPHDPVDDPPHVPVQAADHVEENLQVDHDAVDLELAAGGVLMHDLQQEAPPVAAPHAAG